MSEVKPLRRQRGVASLIVVAMLFFIVSMVAAYTNRNLIFEQRTSANQYRSTQAFEAAEAGVEWVLSMLNAGVMDDSCTPTLDPTDTTFRNRYLSIDPATGVITPAGALSADNGSTVWPSCVFDGTDWSCSCPAAGAPALAAPGGAGVFPAFRARFVRASTTQPGIVRLEVNGCTRLDDGCLDFPAAATAGEGRATLSVLIALRGGLAAPPAAALTARGGIGSVASPVLSAYNAQTGTSGPAVLSGGAAYVLGAHGAAGTPSSDVVAENDTALAALPVDADGRSERMFSSTFAAWPGTYRDQPAAVVLDCSTACTADQIRTEAGRNPGRVLWAEGDVTLDTGGDIGSAAQPVVLVATGNVEVGVTVHGIVYSRAANWDTAGAGEVRGAVVAENALGGNGSFNAVYDPDVLARLRWQSGSFVRVPGGWRDY
jgi:hypothetical protein